MYVQIESESTLDQEAAAQDIVVSSAPSSMSRECRSLRTTCNKDAYICTRALLEHVFVTEPSQNSKETLVKVTRFGFVAREKIFKGEHFYDPSVKWVRGEPPEDLRNKYPNFYAKCSGYKDGGFLQLAAPSPMAFKSTTFFVNEARPGNKLRGSREANTEYSSSIFQMAIGYVN